MLPDNLYMTEAKKHFNPTKEELYLFETTAQGSRCQLKNFLHFLSSQGVKKPYKFAFVEAEGPLLNSLSIRENIHLDFIPTSLSKSKESQMEDFLNVKGNLHLSEFYSQITQLGGLPHQVDNQTRKMAALVKAILQDSTYLFLESPEKFLSQKNLELLIKALNYQINNLGQVVFINTPKKHLWNQHITKVITRDESYNFKIKTNLQLASESGPKSREFPVLENAIREKDTFGHLKFHNLISKKSA